ncbi:MAG: SpoIID/LytB domain-containing protein, partial [Acidobacteriota bacterium]|nr:SpoIID/LytB domain-containing protein [Acidobacteriota bacterium]
QAAALKDEDQSVALAARLADLTQEPADATFDVASSLYRVRVGRFASRDEAESGRRRHRKIGLSDTWVVQEGGRLREPRLRWESAGKVEEVRGRWLALESETMNVVSLGQRDFRGRVLVFLNDRGLLNIINELDLESYLRGVVPLEMGPDLYDNLESLKAQAVAARTFAVKNFGAFATEGFDLCAAPRCQVYGGKTAEHALSDRAIAETAGEVVVYDGQLAEALYSSSCGGATEHVEAIFPRKSADYLRGVPCPESGVTELKGSLPPGLPIAAGLMRLVAPAPAGSAVAATQARLEHMARRSSIDPPPDSLASLRRAELRRYLASAFDLVIDTRLLHGSPSVDGRWSATERRFHSRFADGETGGARVEPAELEAILYDLARLLRLVVEERGYFLSLEGRELKLRVGTQRSRVALPEGLATFGRRGPALVSGQISLAAGDRLRLFRDRDGGLLAAAREAAEPSGRADEREAWARFRSVDRLRRSVAALYPGFTLSRLEILSRGVSQRVRLIRLHSIDGESVDVEGLAVRWTLDLPDTWFHMRVTTQDGKRGWMFEGRGHGHGVGMCQIGAVAMGRRGQTYREILVHYYTGAKLGRLKTG